MRARCLLFAGLMSISTTANAATVSITPSVSAVAQGGSVSFTVTVTPSTYVQKVILTYEGEAGSTEDTSSPYVISHQFDTPMDDLTVTATVKYTNSDPDDQQTVDIDVVGLSISGSATPLRSWPTSYTAESNPAGKAIDQFNWTFEGPGGSNTYQDNDTDGNDKSTWSGLMVTSGTLQCDVVIAGLSVRGIKIIVPAPRNWAIPITCHQDNEADWGDIPFLEATLGQCRDKDSNISVYMFVPRSGNDFLPACTLTQVASGPCSGWWYVSSSTLKCQRETVINKYFKSTGPALGGMNWAAANAECFSSTPADFLQAIKNHEYRGTPETAKSIYGHYGRTEKWIRDQGYDPKQQIEGLSNRVKIVLELEINDIVLATEIEVATYTGNEGEMTADGPNWGGGANSLGEGQNSRWDGSGWTQCVYGPVEF